MAETRYLIGQVVRDGNGRNARVMRHGRDSAGVYTEVRYLNGATERWHRSSLQPHIHLSDGDCDCYYFPKVEG